MTTWEDVKTEYSKLGLDGWEAVKQAIRVGEMLIELKSITPYGEFRTECSRVSILDKNMVTRLISLARHKDLLEQHKPNSQRKALALINGNKPLKEIINKHITNIESESKPHRLSNAEIELRNAFNSDEFEMRDGFITIKPIGSDWNDAITERIFDMSDANHGDVLGYADGYQLVVQYKKVRVAVSKVADSLGVEVIS